MLVPSRGVASGSPGRPHTQRKIPNVLILETVLLVVYFAVLVMLSFYGLHRYKMAWLYYRHKNDVWAAAGALTAWSRVTAAAGWSARFGASLAVWPDGRLALLAGNDGKYRNDAWTWSGRDGEAWTRVTGAAPWPARFRAAVSLQPTRLCILPGEPAYLGDEWCTTLPSGAPAALTMLSAGTAAGGAVSVTATWSAHTTAPM